MKTNRLVAWKQAHVQAALTSMGELCRNPVSSFLAWLIIAIALALPGVLGIILGNVQQLNASWQGNVPTLSVYLKPLPLAQQEALQRQIGSWGVVASTRRISPQQALQHLQAVTQLTDLDQVLPKNPLPTVLVVRPKSSAVQAQTLVGLKERLGQVRGVGFVQLDMRWVQRLLAFLQVGKDLTLYLAVLLAAGVLLIVGNTIRLSLLRHKRDIDVLSLIGATASFIRRPFLYRGFWLGLGGGLVACLILFILQAYLGSAVSRVADLYGSQFRLHGLSGVSSLYLILGAGSLGILGAYLACVRVRPCAKISAQ